VIMSVYPGWAGQRFLEESLSKVEEARAAIDRAGLTVEVEVDGGIDETTGPRCVSAGATVLAAASAIFSAADPGEATRRLSAAASVGAGVVR
jgi:ribulose-phosphate 3-epimerase